jgi:hypothetical protein
LWQQLEDASAHRVSPDPFEAKQHDAVVSPRRISTDITETLIQREQASSGGARRVSDDRIGTALQSFVSDGIHEVA